MAFKVRDIGLRAASAFVLENTQATLLLNGQGRGIARCKAVDRRIVGYQGRGVELEGKSEKESEIGFRLRDQVTLLVFIAQGRDAPSQIHSAKAVDIRIRKIDEYA